MQVQAIARATIFVKHYFTMMREPLFGYASRYAGRYATEAARHSMGDI